MPVYEYACTACDHRIDILHGINDPGPAFCPSCGHEGGMRKLFAPPTIHFKGSGWAKKDRASASGGSRRSGSSQAGGSGESGASGESGSSNESGGAGTSDGAGKQGADSPASTPAAGDRDARATGPAGSAAGSAGASTTRGASAASRD